MMHGTALEAPPPPALRGLTRLWRSRSPVDCTASDSTGRPLVDRVLAARGLGDPAAAARFLEPKLSHLHDPSLIPDLDRAAERLMAAAKTGEPIVIYGDYDVDGVTATAILWHTLRAVAPGAPVTTYVPHRIDEGYGLSSAALIELAAAGAKVVVSVDCGITAREPARAARSAGLDLIITDHHNPPASMDDLPDAFAVVHPRRPDSLYPFGELSGAGVAYKLAWRLATLSAGSAKVGPALRGLLIDLLAFAALGTIADIVPLVGENRVLAHYGLGRIRASAFGGLAALVEASGLGGASIDAYDVGFRLAPRLNACGRLGHAREAVELFTLASAERAAEIATELTRLNNQRRATERAIAEQAAEMVVAAGLDAPDSRAIVLAHKDWHQGVIGIVCSRMVERFGRPTILLAGNGGEWHGSGRSVAGFSLAQALVACGEHLLSHGGHDMAAGLRVSADNLEKFSTAFATIAAGSISSEQMAGTIGIDTDAGLGELTPDTVRALDRLAPFGQGGNGQGNPPVHLRLTGLRLVEPPAPFGAGSRHAGLRVRDDASARVVRLVGWNWGERAATLLRGQRLDAVVTPKLSTWDGRITVEPELHDLRVVNAPD